MSFADAVAAAKDALKRAEFSILTEIDMRQILKRDLSVDFHPYIILSACNSALWHRAIQRRDGLAAAL